MGMMKAIVKFHENCIRVITESSKQERKVSMGYIEQTLGDIMVKLTQMKFQSPIQPEQELRKYFDDLHEEIDNKFRDIQYM
jgi:vacuolar-type H+-ATPase catalytic subunit A/Vma1